MVVHEDNEAVAEPAEEPKYWVTAAISEPKYEAERTFLAAEQAYVERKLAIMRRRTWNGFSLPSLGIYGLKDWRKYSTKLKNYDHELTKYAQAVQDGVLPVKFAVYNATDADDKQIKIEVSVKYGRIDTDRKPPSRPARVDARSKPWSLPKLPAITAFSRTNVKLTEHHVKADFSELGPKDAAMLVNKLVHLHTGPDTQVKYEISSRNVPHETGDVYL